MKQPHEWTNDEGKVLVVKCLDTQRRGYGGFPYPKTGTVIAPEIWDATWGTQPQKWIGGWDRKTECAILLQRWIDSENNAQHALLIADSTHIGKTVTVRMGVISEN